MRVAIYSISRDRLAYMVKSYKFLRTMAGIEFDLFVFDNASEQDARAYLKAERLAGRIKYLKLSDYNVGQNLAANHLLQQIGKDDYDWVLRWDPDGIPRTRRFLKKLVEGAEAFKKRGVLVVASPTITRLKYPPQPIAIGDDLDGYPYEVVTILGGICRLHHEAMFRDFRFSRFGPLGFGEASEMSTFCKNAEIPMVRLTDLEIEHAGGEDRQKDECPEEFTWERREVGRYVSYGL